MAVSMVIRGATLGEAFAEVIAVLYDTVKNVGNKDCSFKPHIQNLESTLDRLLPIVKDIKRSINQIDFPEKKTKSLIEEMKMGETLIRKCSKKRWWNCCFEFCCPTELSELNEDIARFCKDDLEANSTRNDETEISMNLNIITLEKEDSSNLDRPRAFCAVRRPPNFTVGFDMPMMELKTLLLKEEVKQLLLTAPAGCGKTTLVQMLCQDNQIKGMFTNNILFVNVSKTPDMKVIVQNLFSYKGIQPKYQIQSDEDAIYLLPQMLKHIGPNPILLILDDVWLGSEFLLEKLKFNIPNYKILVTSRTAFPRFKHTYNLKQLNEVDAMTLFCRSAFLQDESSYIPEEDIKKIVRGCGGCPLALKIIGGSLCGQHAVVWHSRLLKWSDGHFFFNSDTELLPHLQKSLEFPDDKIIIKECFLDLCSFWAEQRIPATTLIDMWAELYKLDDIHAIAYLQELTIRNLAKLVMTRKDASEVNSYYNEDFVTQHHIFRELALHHNSQEPIGQRLRLIMNISGNNQPKWWMEKKQLINARLLSISTDESFLWSWCNIQAPKVEVLILNFQTKNYTLPYFVEKANELKVLIVSNYGFFHAEIKNFELLWSLPNLKRIRLEKISISSLCETLVPLKNLRKISLFMCNIGKAFENCTNKVSYALPNLEEINIDYCNDLVELPVGLCDIVHLKKLYITNCHKLSILPKGTGKLVNLEDLRLRSCTDLSELPESIRSLHKLSILDISNCLSISKLPKHIGELCNLKVLNMKGCLRLRNSLPESTMDLKQLKIVVCDEERAKLWEPIKEFLTKLKIEVAKNNINLNWLLK
ncbi:probable disease resistance protein At5g66900 [Quercus lobata]|uniref:RPW8 domain-containing protein n=1 Tax=Quercus lobata TaxID=97700 RepID=A0A7N2R6X9_QUELO|nr:probable disease resistance protein At5g66900 [Quercus lobata]XP_030975195.1 probable disease resistance protein At5g66900 [Quercus lobata]XP_030975196.1 probable disease resistance protein At5g66900 [Quercus lobata]XP_030975197.1 probable disease resistance protein At5g66900 [Quercus lobata]XP_030975198.1 probable disease resistance protein At5g66900 [Quercus lobata]XP_030975199.1 probable disease resistance protein At5g66900 [Quercus lobata]XP_030975200.1 probable disease resistance prot